MEVFGETFVFSNGVVCFPVVVQVDGYTCRACSFLKPGDELVEQSLLTFLCNGLEVARVEYLFGLMGTGLEGYRIRKTTVYRL